MYNVNYTSIVKIKKKKDFVYKNSLCNISFDIIVTGLEILAKLQSYLSVESIK